MKYIKGNFYIEDVFAKKIALKFGTPVYCYSLKILRQNIKLLKKNFQPFNPLICFAVKANSNLDILKEIKKNGCGADVVSVGEMMRALKAGIKPNKIVFSGVGKTVEELTFAIKKNIFLINVESINELQKIIKISKKTGKITNIGIRLNPNVDANTIKQISTGKKDNKFGIVEKFIYDTINLAKNSKNINLKCLSVHIGSQIVDYKPFISTLAVIERVIKKSNFKFEFVDLGGGMGIPYSDKSKIFNYTEYSKSISKFIKRNDCKIIFEPGRSIIGNTAILISKIIYIKRGQRKSFVILDAGMNDFMRPALYKAEHKIIPIIKKGKKNNTSYEFVGPICETTDSFLSIKKFQKLNEGDLIGICDVGAYGSSLSSNYNVRPNISELLISQKKIKVITKRQKISDLI